MYRQLSWMTMVFCFLCTSFIFSEEAKTNDILEIGIGARDITPPVPYRMAGYFSERPSTGTSDALLAKAMVLRQGKAVCVFIICDIITISSEQTDSIRKQINEKTGIPRDSIIISATHSHTGPLYLEVLRNYLHEKRIKETGKDDLEILDYSQLLITQGVEAAMEAFTHLQPARLSVGKAINNSLSFNRRYHMTSGPVVFNPGLKNPNIVKAAGPIDPEINIAFFSNAETGKPICSFTNFALHLDTTGGTLYSADYPFYLSESLKNHYGHNFFSLFGTGTCGDINHFDAIGGATPLKANVIGAKLGETILAALSKDMKETQPVLGIQEKIVKWPRQQYSMEETAKAESKLSEVFEQQGNFLERVKNYKVYQLSKREKEFDLDIQAVRLSDDFAIITLPGEIFVDLGLAIKKASPFKHTMVIELSQTSVSYVPTKKAFIEGSYETVNSFLAPGGGEKMVETALELLNQLKKK